MLAILSQKGGSGKITLTLHLAVIAQAAGLRTVLVDCDPQRSAAGWWRARKADTPELIEAEPARLAAAIEAARADGVDLVVVDTRPSVEQDTLDVARLADLALIPTRPSILDLRAIKATVDVVQAAKRPAGIVLNSCPPGTERPRGDVDGGGAGGAGRLWAARAASVSHATRSAVPRPN